MLGHTQSVDRRDYVNWLLVDGEEDHSQVNPNLYVSHESTALLSVLIHKYTHLHSRTANHAFSFSYQQAREGLIMCVGVRG